MIYIIENENLKVSVETLGAQLKSVYSKDTSTEYLWQGDKKYWTGRAYNLFPYVGRFVDGKYSVEGKIYEMDRHGFARGSEFVLTQKTDESMTFCISATDSTKQIYPFDFIFYVRYSLLGKKLQVEYKVVNVGKNVMYFGLGGHPGFNVPFDGGEFEDYYVEFENNCSPLQIIANEKGLITPERKRLSLKDFKKIELRHDLFDNDAIIMEDVVKAVYLKGKNTSRSIKVSFEDMSYLGLWHMPKTDAPYLCIEPWKTLPSNDGCIEVLESKKEVGVLKPNERYVTYIGIEINE